MMNRRDFYRILHVQPDAPTEIIRASYITLMRRLEAHPDLGGDHWNAALINEAYGILRNPASRARYDKELSAGTAPGRVALLGPGRSPLPAVAAKADPTPAPLVRALAACLFCGGVNAALASAQPAAVCYVCASPLWEVSPERATDDARRALARTPRRMPIQYYVTWPQAAPFHGVTADLSVAGMGFVTRVDLSPQEIIKVVSPMMDAIAVVRHVRVRTTARTREWVAGIEFVTFRVKVGKGSLVSIEA